MAGVRRCFPQTERILARARSRAAADERPAAFRRCGEAVDDERVEGKLWVPSLRAVVRGCTAIRIVRRAYCLVPCRQFGHGQEEWTRGRWMLFKVVFIKRL